MNTKSVRSLTHAKLCKTCHSFGPHESLEPGFACAGDVGGVPSSIVYAVEKFESARPQFQFNNRDIQCQS